MILVLKYKKNFTAVFKKSFTAFVSIRLSDLVRINHEVKLATDSLVTGKSLNAKIL
jgi:hypothetical protein